MRERTRADDRRSRSRIGDAGEGDILEALDVRRAATLSALESRHAGGEHARDDPADAGDDIERTEQRILLDALLRVLGPAERVIVRLRIVDGMTWARLAVAVGLPEIQVSRIVRRALARMHDAAVLQEVDGARAHDDVPRARWPGGRRGPARRVAVRPP